MIDGELLRFTLVLAFPTHPLASVITQEYVPLLLFDAFAITGFCSVELNPLGPVQLNVTPPEALSCSGAPKQLPPTIVVAAKEFKELVTTPTASHAFFTCCDLKEQFPNKSFADLMA